MYDPLINYDFMEKIDILLACYNGEKYIEQQIYSILTQTHANWELIIHDDGSDDRTVEIVKTFCQSDPRIRLVEDKIILKNAAKNFLHLLSYSTSSYACFCDQDDIWFENKLSSLYASIKDSNSVLPTVVFSNAYVWTSDEGIRGMATMVFPHNLEELLYLNCGIQGASSIFNLSMINIMRRQYKHIAMHDHLLTLAGAALGEIKYISKPLMLYRQHDKNVTGKTDTTFKDKIRRFIFPSQIPVIDQSHFEGVRAFYDVHQDELSVTTKKILNFYLNSPSMNNRDRLIGIFKNRYSIYQSRLLLFAKLLIRPYFNK